MKITVAICTRDRPQMLRVCLGSLFAQALPSGTEVTAVVIENSPTPLCRSLVEDAARSVPSGWTVVYAHEPRLGIPIARNHALDVALKLTADWIAFIDDDERANANWIAAMVRGTELYAADAFQGPVHYEYLADTPDWITKKKLKNRASGTPLETAFTNNVMMSAKIARSGLRFDEAMLFTGGEDSDFFHRAADNGWKLCWVSGAVVTETVQSNRMTLRWQLDRSKQVATNATLLHIKRKGLGPALVTHGSKGLRRITRGIAIGLIGAILIPLTKTLGKRTAASGLTDAWSGAGSIVGFLHTAPQPYLKTDGM